MGSGGGQTAMTVTWVILAGAGRGRVRGVLAAPAARPADRGGQSRRRPVRYGRQDEQAGGSPFAAGMGTWQ